MCSWSVLTQAHVDPAGRPQNTQLRSVSGSTFREDDPRRNNPYTASMFFYDVAHSTCDPVEVVSPLPMPSTGLMVTSLASSPNPERAQRRGVASRHCRRRVSRGEALRFLCLFQVCVPCSPASWWDSPSFVLPQCEWIFRFNGGERSESYCNTPAINLIMLK